MKKIVVGVIIICVVILGISVILFLQSSQKEELVGQAIYKTKSDPNCIPCTPQDCCGGISYPSDCSNGCCYSCMLPS